MTGHIVIGIVEVVALVVIAAGIRYRQIMTRHYATERADLHDQRTRNNTELDRDMAHIAELYADLDQRTRDVHTRECQANLRDIELDQAATFIDQWVADNPDAHTAYLDRIIARPRPAPPHPRQPRRRRPSPHLDRHHRPGPQLRRRHRLAPATMVDHETPSGGIIHVVEDTIDCGPTEMTPRPSPTTCGDEHCPICNPLDLPIPPRRITPAERAAADGHPLTAGGFQ